MSDDPHAGIEFQCGAEIEAKDVETGEDVEIARCTKTLTWEEHGTHVRSAPDDLGFESGALKFVCDSCGNVAWRCPVCTDSDDNAPPGWYRGESTGAQMACHNCNAQEAQRQMQDPHWPP